MSAMQRYLATSGRAEGELSAITLGDRESLESQLQGQLGLAQDQVGLGQEKLTRDLVEGEVGIAGLGTIKTATKGLQYLSGLAKTGAKKVNNIANVYERLGGNRQPLDDLANTLNRGGEATSSPRNVFDTLSRQRSAPSKVVREDGQAINPEDLTKTSVDDDLVPLPKGKAPAQTPDYASLDEPGEAVDLDVLTGRPLAARETMADLGKGLPSADVEGLEDEEEKIARIDPNLREYPTGGDGYGGRSTLDVDEPGAAVERAPITGYELAGQSADVQSGIADAIAGRRRPPAAKPPQPEPEEELPFPEVESQALAPQQAQASSVDDLFAQARARSQAKADAIPTDPEDPGSAPSLLAREPQTQEPSVGGGNEGQVEGDLAEREGEEGVGEEGSSIFGNLFKGGVAEGLGTLGEIASGIGDVALLGTGIKDLVDSKKMFSEQEDQYNKEKSALSSMGTQPQEGTGEIAMGVFDSSAEPISDATFSHF